MSNNSIKAIALYLLPTKAIAFLTQQFLNRVLSAKILLAAYRQSRSAITTNPNFSEVFMNLKLVDSLAEIINNLTPE
ncbi:MAG: hypothetical protein F6K35_41390 [Okeania sp. SIO2H7]|nr:hypothetical protein [Okeania sp. SIO2H7]